MLLCPIPCMRLLSRHNQTNLSFGVPDQVSAHIHGDAVDLTQQRMLGRDG